MKTTHCVPLVALLGMVFAVPSLVSAATYTVTNAASDGPGTLRAAIDAANTSTPPITITFNLPGSPPFLIALTNVLPDINVPVFIDGASQPGYSNNVPIVEVSGAPLGGAWEGLHVYGGNSRVRGLILSNFSNNPAMRIVGLGSNRVEGCYVLSNRDGNTIGGPYAGARNVISGNRNAGVNLNTTATGKASHRVPAAATVSMWCRGPETL
jgi:hypothetical protein